MTLPIAICEAEGNFSKLSIINNEFRRTILYLQKMILQNRNHMKRRSRSMQEKKCMKKILYTCLGSQFIKMFCYFSEFCFIFYICLLFLNLYIVVISFLILNKCSLSYLIFYSFFLRGGGPKLYTPQAPQNLKPSLVSVKGGNQNQEK